MTHMPWQDFPDLDNAPTDAGADYVPPANHVPEWEREGRLGKASGQHHGFRHPDGTTTSHLVKDATPEQAVAMYREWLDLVPSLAAAARTELVGRDLMCWCPTDQPCHANVLLELANQTSGSSR